MKLKHFLVTTTLLFVSSLNSCKTASHNKAEVKSQSTRYTANGLVCTFYATDYQDEGKEVFDLAVIKGNVSIGGDMYYEDCVAAADRASWINIKGVPTVETCTVARNRGVSFTSYSTKEQYSSGVSATANQEALEVCMDQRTASH